MPDGKSFGWRDLFVVIYVCPSLCLSCDFDSKSCTFCAFNSQLTGNPDICTCLNGLIYDEILKKCS